jgi:hypothetical protein
MGNKPVFLHVVGGGGGVLQGYLMIGWLVGWLLLGFSEYSIF